VKLKDLLTQCEAGLFLDPEQIADEGHFITAMVYLPQWAKSAQEEIASGFYLQYGTLHGWGEYELSVWARVFEVTRQQWRYFIDVVEQAGGSVEISAEALDL
jgi:hypothetical protein